MEGPIVEDVSVEEDGNEEMAALVAAVRLRRGDQGGAERADGGAPAMSVARGARTGDTSTWDRAELDRGGVSPGSLPKHGGVGKRPAPPAGSPRGWRISFGLGGYSPPHPLRRRNLRAHGLVSVGPETHFEPPQSLSDYHGSVAVDIRPTHRSLGKRNWHPHHH